MKYLRDLVCLLTLVAATSPISVGAVTVVQRHKLLASDGAFEDMFGSDVALRGTIALIGAPGDEDNGLDSGSAYLFDVHAGTQLVKLKPSDGHAFELFGGSIALTEDTAVVGLIGGSGNGVVGSAYLFDVASGEQLFKLLPSDIRTGDDFGYSVAIAGDYAVIGAREKDSTGAAYVFDVATGSQLAKLSPDDGVIADRFGCSVAISGNTAIIGANGHDENGLQAGSVYLFDISSGAQLAKLSPNDAGPTDGFGYSVAVSGNTAIIGAVFDEVNGVPFLGSAYLFDIPSRTQIAKLTPNDGNPFGQFGVRVAIDGDYAVVGASVSGAAYLFNSRTGEQLAKLTPSVGTPSDYFGSGVAISGNKVLVGAFGDNEITRGSGAAYVFEIVPEPHAAILVTLGILGLQCFAHWHRYI